MRASPSTQAAVEATLQQWKDAYSRRDVDGALAVIAPDDDVVGIGTGPDEWRVGPEEFKAQLDRDFAQADGLSVDYEPLVISEAGPVAWVAGRARVQARVEGQDVTLTCGVVVELRGFEPLTPCMPYMDLRPDHGRYGC